MTHIFCGPAVVSVTQPTVSKHRMKQNWQRPVLLILHSSNTGLLMEGLLGCLHIRSLAVVPRV